MHALNFERYQQRDSIIHQLDPRVKVLATILFIVANVLLPDGAWLAFLWGLGLIWLVARLSRLGLWFSVKRSVVALPFALAAVTIMFTLPGNPVLVIAIGPWRPTLTDAGLLRFISILIRSFLSVQMAIILTAVTTFPDLMHALRHLRVPQPLILIVSFMYRYLVVLADEAQRLLRAREARSGRLDGYKSGGTLVWRARVVGNMAGQLFLRSYERSDRVYKAMVARGYRGYLLTMNPHVMHRRDWQVGGLFVLLLLGMQLLGTL